MRHPAVLGHPHPRRARGSEQRIGWAELVALPDLGLTGLSAKMDSGAATSALSAANVAMRQADDGSHWVDFTFCQAGGDAAVPCSARLVGHRSVRSSNGRREVRPVIETTIALGTLRWQGQFTLTNRRAMRFPVLIGRRALRRGFIVDCSRRWLLGRPETKDAL